MNRAKIEYVLGRIARSYITITTWRVALLYLLLALLRVVFYICNRDLIGEISWNELGALAAGAFKFDTASIIYANGLWAVLSLLPLHSRSKVWYNNMLFAIYMITNTILIIVANLADTIYFHYALKRFSADELIFSENGNNTTLIGEFAADNWWMLPFTIVTVTLLGIGYRRNAKVSGPRQRAAIYYPIQTILLLCAIWLSVGGMRGGFTHAIRPITLSNATHYTTDGNKAFLILSNPFCIIRTLGSEAITEPKYFADDVLDSLYSPYHYPTADAVANASHRGYNVMVFILESFSAENSAHLSPDLYKDGDAGYTPFLDSLMRNGVTLRKMYANGYQSISGTPSVIGSIPSLKKSFILLPNSIGESHQMPAMLRDMGYSTTFFCGSERASMGFSAYAHSAGFDAYVAREDYEAAHGTNDFDGSWGIWDRPFMEFVSDELTAMKEPFFASQFTISSHHPFKLPEGWIDQSPAGATKIQPVTAYSDAAIRNFFERSSDKPWFNKTIFVFVADHVSSEKMADRTLKYPGNSHIMGAIYTPDGSLKGEINEVTQQIDIMPTILNMLGNSEPYFAYGRDIFSTESNRMPRWSISYVGGKTTAYDDRRGVVSTDDCDTLKAFEQQYYKHIVNRSYTAPKR